MIYNQYPFINNVILSALIIFRPPIKPRLITTQTSHHDDSPARTSSVESLRSTRSSTEQLSLHEEPFYDIVAPDDASMVTSTFIYKLFAVFITQANILRY